jgi:hypothetical protein
MIEPVAKGAILWVGIAVMIEITAPVPLAAAIGILFIILLGEMTVELVTHFFCQPKIKRAKYKWDREVGKKMLRIAMIVACTGLDAAAYVGSSYMPENWTMFKEGVPLATLTTIVWFLFIELWKIGQNFSNSEGIEELPPIFRWVIAQIRKVDAFRKPLDGDDSRWYDELENLSDEEIVRFLEAAKRKESE